MEELRKLVDELIALPGGEEQEAIVEQLQEIGKKLIAEYEIKIGDITVDPIWIEAYYSNANQGFVDPFAYNKDEQKGKYGLLFFHQKLDSDSNENGVDICLSTDNNVCLSFLLKKTLVNGEYTHQPGLNKKIHREYLCLSEEEQGGVLRKRKAENKAKVVGCTKRIFQGVNPENLDDVEKKFLSYDLAIVKDFDKKDYPTSNGRLPSIESLTDSYLDTYDGDKKTECERILGYCRAQYKDK